ncbi:MFS transporter [Rhodopseudomonas pseudopalustris]|uniref:Predicted arabinose efflux permease, MFS family n=1 Tax=Rhodopseudomonas pseudopalustris TaxID=1513892 RepID=A0A1H8Q4P7_9BRAD|nr:MFS transporter [Rhodopseudomonas pseudopalustris]SEO48941.1 Predicted arabinose efflux permease, MFS family [Rhodopseudomonas pseudopalustris]
MLGNFVTGTSVLAPAGMLGELSADLGVTIAEAGLLITFGAVVLCIGSPLTAWLTSRIERRLLLTATLLVMTLANFASALAPGYAALLIIRLISLSVGSLYTPQSAGAVALITPPERRGGAMTYVFLGWSLAVAFGVPLVTYVASHYGWRAAFVVLGALGCLSVVLLALRLPGGLKAAPVDLRTWVAVGRSRPILTLLGITALHTSGQFVVFTYIGPLLLGLTGAGAAQIGLAFALYGVGGFVGNMIASRIVDGWGAFNTSVLFVSLMLTGITLWSVGAGIYAVMALGVAIWGLGFAATNSMQQVRLVAADPSLAGATMSLNTSVLYVGQAIGSAIGGALFAAGLPRVAGFAAMALIALALAAVLLATRERKG